MKILEFKHVSKDFNDGEIRVKALKNINLEFYIGEFVAIVGPSGCGKSTLLNLISKMYCPSDGEIILNNKSLRDYNDEEWCNVLQNEIGFIYQNYELIDFFNIVDNLQLKSTLMNKNKLLDNMLEKLAISLQKYQKSILLSGGQKQRVSFIRALINNPYLILADEPTGSLDSKNSEILMNFLSEYSYNSLVIMVTHNEELARRYASKIIYMDHGEVMKIEEIRKVLKNNSFKKRRVNKYYNLSNKVIIKYILELIKKLRIRFIFLISSGCFIFIFISILFTVINSATQYVEDKFMFDPLYNVFNFQTYYMGENDIEILPINKYVLRSLINKYNNCHIRENIDPILNNNLIDNIYFDDKQMSNVTAKCLGNKLNEKSFKYGRNINKINEVVVNSVFADYFKNENILGRKIKITHIIDYNGKNKFKEYELDIVGITNNAMLNQSMEIYFDYSLIYDEIKNSYLNNKTYFDVFYSFDYQLVINNLKDVKTIIKNFKSNPYYRDKTKIPSHTYHFSFINNTAYDEADMYLKLIKVISLLVYFFVFLGLIIFLIFISYVLNSLVIDRKKDYAIFIQLGVKGKVLDKIFVTLALIIATSMVFLGLFFLILIIIIFSYLNSQFKVKFPLISLFMLIAFFYVICVCAIIMPIKNLKRIEIGNIIKSD